MEYIQVGFMLLLLTGLTLATNRNGKEYEAKKKHKNDLKN